MILLKLLAVRLVTFDPQALARFYGEALGATSAGGEACVPMRLGAQTLELIAFNRPGAPYPADVAADDPRFQHVAVVVADARAACTRALDCGASLISRGGAVQLPASAGGAVAAKLRDPEGHPFEVIQFPSGEWDAVTANARGVKGLDHSAIVVRDAAASRRFYEEWGLSVRGGSLNKGPTQAALDGLTAPVVDVVPLYAGVGTPHLELLGYHGARSAPVPVGDGDLAATRLVWAADTEAALLRDPDGHRHQLVAAR